MSRPEFILYRWWDAEGNLLYVGKSISLFARISAHRKSSAFFPEATQMTIERFPDEVTLAVAEVNAIRDEHPLYNIVHKREGGTPRKLAAAPQTVASHWASIDGDDIQIGDLIRHTQDGEVVLQGLVDDDLYDCEDCDDTESCIAWIVWADDGAVQYCHEAEFALGGLEKWLSIDADDETIANAFGAWLHGRARLIHMDRVAS